MSDWDPALYRAFEAERTRPAADLLARVQLPTAERAVDLGCGPGNSTELVAARFPEAAVVGVDASDAMLADARGRLPALRFEKADVAAWAPAEAPDLVFANAVLQWVPNHRDLIPRLFRCLTPGGVLAFQVPDTLDEPSHALMRTLADAPRWRGLIGSAAGARAGIVLAAEAYYDLLVPEAAAVDAWRTTYHHPMRSPADIVNWLRSTGLRPFLDPLPADARTAFLAEYEGEVARAYGIRADGGRLLAFPRLFVVARRAREHGPQPRFALSR